MSNSQMTADFDIYNDGGPQTVLRQNFHSRAVEGERYTIFPHDSWVHDLRVVEHNKEYYAKLRADISTNHSPSPGKGYELVSPFPSTSIDYYALKVLSIDGRTMMFASAIRSDYSPAWEDTTSPSDPAKIFFEVENSGKLATVCSFAEPYRLGSQL